MRWLALTSVFALACDSRSIVTTVPDGGLCARTTNGATVTMRLPDGAELRCAFSPDAGLTPGPPPPRIFRGKITGGETDTLILDACEPGATCIPNGLTIEVHTVDLDLRAVPRVWVQVRFQLGFFRGCHHSLEITTADPTDGSPAAGPAGQLLVAVVDGADVLPGAPYQMTRVALDCSPGKGCGSVAPDDYAFDVGAADGNESPLRVLMGQTVTWVHGGRSLAVRNLRSFQTTACDDYWNFAFYITPK